MILIIVILFIFIVLLARKDALSFLLKDNISLYTPTTADRINRWHRDGVLIWLIFTLSTAYYSHTYISTPILSLLIRLSVFDYCFNKWAKLSITYLGSTAFWDKIFIKVFGVNGAIKKSLFFIVLSLLYIIFLKVIMHVSLL